PLAPPRGAPIAWGPFALAASVLIALVIVLLVRTAGRAPQQAQAHPEASVVPPTAPPATAPREPEQAPRRDQERRVVRLPRKPVAPTDGAVAATTRTVRIEVRVDARPPSFEAVIRDAKGKEVWRGEDLPPPRSSEAPLVVPVPAAVLVAGDYTLSV